MYAPFPSRATLARVVTYEYHHHNGGWKATIKTLDNGLHSIAVHHSMIEEYMPPPFRIGQGVSAMNPNYANPLGADVTSVFDLYECGVPTHVTVRFDLDSANPDWGHTVYPIFTGQWTDGYGFVLGTYKQTSWSDFAGLFHKQ